MSFLRGISPYALNPLRLIARYSKHLFIPFLLLSAGAISNAERIERREKPSNNREGLREIFSELPTEIQTEALDTAMFFLEFNNMCKANEWDKVSEYITLSYHNLEFVVFKNMRTLSLCVTQAAIAGRRDIITQLQLYNYDLKAAAESIFDTICAHLNDDEKSIRNLINAFDFLLICGVKPEIKPTQPNLAIAVGIIASHDYANVIRYLKNTNTINIFQKLVFPFSDSDTPNLRSMTFIEIACHFNAVNTADYILEEYAKHKALAKLTPRLYFHSAMSPIVQNNVLASQPKQDVLDILIKHKISFLEEDIFYLLMKISKSSKHDSKNYADLSSGFSILVERMPHPNIYNEYGTSLLAWLIAGNLLNELQMVLNHPRVNLYIPYGKNEDSQAIFIAVIRDNPQAVLMMYEKGFDIRFVPNEKTFSFVDFVFFGMHINFFYKMAESSMSKRLVDELSAAILEKIWMPIPYAVLGGIMLAVIRRLLRKESKKTNIEEKSDKTLEIQTKKTKEKSVIVKRTELPKKFGIAHELRQVTNQEIFAHQYSLCENLQNDLEKENDQTTLCGNKCLNIDLIREDNRSAQRGLVERTVNECKSYDEGIYISRQNLKKLSVATPENIVILEEIKHGLLQLKTKIQAAAKVIEAETEALNKSLARLQAQKAKQPQTLFAAKHNKVEKITKKSVKPKSAVANVNISTQTISTNNNAQFSTREMPEIKQESIVTNSIFKSVNAYKNKYKAQKNLAYIHGAYQSLLNIYKLQSLTALDNEVRHFALIYNFFRLVHGIKTYYERGGHTRILSVEQIQGLKIFRNLLRHEQAIVLTQEQVLKTAAEICLDFPSLLVSMCSPTSNEYALTASQLNELDRLFDTNEVNWALTSIFNDLPAAATLESKHEEKSTNDRSQTDIDYDLNNVYLPLIRRILLDVEHGYGAAEESGSKYGYHWQALRMLLAMCADLRQHNHNKDYKDFLGFAGDIGWRVGHRYPEDYVMRNIYERLQQALFTLPCTQDTNENQLRLCS